MPTLTIKDIPAEIHEELKETARVNNRSLNSYIIAVLKISTEERNRRKLMKEGAAEFRKFVRTLPPMDDSTALIREGRDSSSR